MKMIHRNHEVSEEKTDMDKRFDFWMETQAKAAIGIVDVQILRYIFDAMDDEDKTIVQ